MYTVKQVASILGVSVHTVRYYDDRGLIPGSKRNQANQRVFDDLALEWLFVSLTLHRTGLPLEEVKRYISLYQQGESTLGERFQLMQAQRTKILQELNDLHLRLAVLDRKIEHYEALLQGQADPWDHTYLQNLIWKGRKQDDP